jgi:acyl-CoA thioesterase FadM
MKPISVPLHVETGDIHAEGNTRMVLFNGNTGRPMAIPDWFTDKYLK